jgi:acetolactate synthase regulatory subunit
MIAQRHRGFRTLLLNMATHMLDFWRSNLKALIVRDNGIKDLLMDVPEMA